MTNYTALYNTAKYGYSFYDIQFPELIYAITLKTSTNKDIILKSSINKNIILGSSTNQNIIAGSSTNQNPTLTTSTNKEIILN